MTNNKGKTLEYSDYEPRELTEVLLRLAETHKRVEVFNLLIDYLTSTINGSGCSIFEVDPSTDELYMVASSHILKKEWKQCNYERGEGFTGWPFKYKKLLYVPDEKDHEYMSNIKPEPPTHKGKMGGKPCETDPIGPFMAAPIISRRHLFNLNLTYNQYLRNVDVNKELINVFKDKGYPISKNAKILEINDKEWEIIDKTVSYTVKEFGKELNISNEYVIGVIRLPTTKGKRKEYTQTEQNIFTTFAERLSEVIENTNLIEKQKKLIHLLVLLQLQSYF